jgi:hypothetical protein
MYGRWLQLWLDKKQNMKKHRRISLKKKYLLCPTQKVHANMK